MWKNIEIMNTDVKNDDVFDDNDALFFLSKKNPLLTTTDIDRFEIKWWNLKIYSTWCLFKLPVRNKFMK